MNYIFLSKDSPDSLKNQLAEKGAVILIEHCNTVYKSISSHGDIFIFCCEDKIFIAREQYELIKESLDAHPFNLEIIDNALGETYPKTAAFNAVLLGGCFIHKLNVTSPAILNEIKRRDKKIINIKQGYSRCSILPVDENSVITSDIGIEKTLAMNGIDVCHIRPGFIKLSGQEYGFIGGAGGRIDNNIYFAGDISLHPDYDKINKFICKRGLDIIFEKGFPLTDIGSILCFKI
jgi:hypothetical protein